MLEREIKLSYPTREEARAAIVAAGASPLHPRRLQDDELFDTDDERLRRQGAVLRLRCENGCTVMTLKGPAEPDAAMKLRHEHETSVADGSALRQVFEHLGLRVWFRYQKYREEYAGPEVIVALDDTPLGTFVEIEGTEHGILAMTRALGRTTDDFILQSYRSLFVAHRETTGLAHRDMVFPDA